MIDNNLKMEIIHIACRLFEVTDTDFYSTSRDNKIMDVRRMVSAWLFEYYGMTVAEIAQVMKRIRPFITHQIFNNKKMCERDMDYRERYELYVKTLAKNGICRESNGDTTVQE